jgi:hypothetical protein
MNRLFWDGMAFVEIAGQITRPNIGAVIPTVYARAVYTASLGSLKLAVYKLTQCVGPLTKLSRCV